MSGWAAQGVPLKVACSGIDRYFERYYRKGPRRRPVKIDFCEADVLDVFDEWRRAVGVTRSRQSPVISRQSAVISHQISSHQSEQSTSVAAGTSRARRAPAVVGARARVARRRSSMR